MRQEVKTSKESRSNNRMKTRYTGEEEGEEIFTDSTFDKGLEVGGSDAFIRNL